MPTLTTRKTIIVVCVLSVAMWATQSYHVAANFTLYPGIAVLAHAGGAASHNSEASA